MMKQTLGASITFLVLCMSITSADVTVDYQANPDPTTVGWTLSGNGSPEISQAGTEGDGTKYWEFKDGSSALANFTISDGISYGSTKGSSIGWTMTAVVKAIDVASANSSCQIRMTDYANIWQMGFYNDGVYVWYDSTGTGSYANTVVKSIDMTDAYHTVQMTYDPSITTASIYVDGVKAVDIDKANINNSLAPYGMYWGSGSTGSSGEARWNAVTFETGINVVPEPASMLLLGLGGVAALIRKRK